MPFNQITALGLGEGRDPADRVICASGHEVSSCSFSAAWWGEVFFPHVPGAKGSSESLAARRNGSRPLIKPCCFSPGTEASQISLTPRPSTVTNRHNRAAPAIRQAGSAGEGPAPGVCLLLHRWGEIPGKKSREMIWGGVKRSLAWVIMQGCSALEVLLQLQL